MLKIAIVSPKLSEYRRQIYALLAKRFGAQIHVFIQMAETGDIKRNDQDVTITVIDEWGHGQQSLKNKVGNWWKVQSGLKIFRPDVIVADDVGAMSIHSAGYSVINRIPLVTVAHQVAGSHAGHGVFPRLLATLISVCSKAFITTGKNGQRWLESKGRTHDACFASCVAIDYPVFLKRTGSASKTYDFIFCQGQLTDIDMLFSIDVCVHVAKALHRKVRILFVEKTGHDAYMESVSNLFPGLIDAEYRRYLDYDELREYFRSARILLYPSARDPWSVVVNQACASGLPVIASRQSSVAGELIRDGENGFVCGSDVTFWAEKAILLIKDDNTYQQFSSRSESIVQEFDFNQAAVGIVAACQYALATKTKLKSASSTKLRSRVVIVERQLLQYRVAFYNRLRALLEQEGIELQLLIGNGTPEEEKKKDEVSLDWAIRIPTRYLFGATLCWQPFGPYAREADLVIVMHENKIIYNLWLLSFGRPKRLAFWGHGRNMQSNNPNGMKERFKRWTVNKVDWWFAYTESSAELVSEAGFPRECTTVVENAFDTEEMTSLCKQVSAVVCQRKREELNLGNGPIGLYLGALYKEKRLDFLLEAAHRIREKIPDFQLLVGGAGPEQYIIEEASAKHPWIHYLGPLQDRNKAVALVLADVMLNPGLVGLGILDSFASGTPMFTTDCGLHSPEISYMSPGTNGVITQNDVSEYADAVVRVLSQPDMIARLSKGALSSAARYTVDNMAGRILHGIRTCLATSRPITKERA
jgi:glycosyltransferase involved in cell wall biosynthesis